MLDIPCDRATPQFIQHETNQIYNNLSNIKNDPYLYKINMTSITSKDKKVI